MVLKGYPTSSGTESVLSTNRGGILLVSFHALVAVWCLAVVIVTVSTWTTSSAVNYILVWLTVQHAVLEKIALRI
jgi:hypothetical protein